MVLALIGLSGCGGGSGGGSTPPANQAPVATSSCAYDAGLNQPFNGMVIVNDPEGQSLTYSVVTNGSKGNVSMNAFSGTFTYMPTNLNTSRGADSFSFRACEPAPSTLCSNVATYKIVHTPRIMPLGDSITQGNTTPNPPPNDRVGYRKFLRDSLTSAGYQVDFVGTLTNGAGAGLVDEQHEGHGACTADELVNGTGLTSCQGNDTLSIWLNTVRPDVVLLHIGTNDLGPIGDQSGEWTDVQNIRTTINSWASSNWPVTVIYARIINTNPATSETTTFNDNVRDNVVQPAINNGEQAILVDHESAISALAGDYGDDKHPNPTGYAKMANVWLRPLTGTGTSSPGDRYPPSLPPGFLPKCP